MFQGSSVIAVALLLLSVHGFVNKDRSLLSARSQCCVDIKRPGQHKRIEASKKCCEVGISSYRIDNNKPGRTCDEVQNPKWKTETDVSKCLKGKQ